MAEGTYKLIKENSESTYDEKEVQAESGKVLGFDSGLNPVMVDPGAGATTFLALTDTPSAYTGQAGKYPKVNVAENALEFDIPGAGDFATKALDNLASTAVNANIIPASDSAIDLGSSSKYWANLYVDTIYSPAINGGSAANDDITIQGTTHATRTTSYVNLQPNGGYVGIGTTAPVSALEINGRFTQRNNASNEMVMRAYPLTGTNKNRAYDLYSNADINNSALLNVALAPTAGWYSVVGGAFILSGKNGTGTTQNLYILSCDTAFDVTKGITLQANTGRFGFGISSPTAVLHIKAGTAIASTAPLKFTSGTLLSSPEAGAVEFLTDNIHLTISTGSARKGIVLDDGARLTSGKIPIATTNGRLVDGQTPLSGTKVYYVADSSGGAVTRKLTFINGILTSET